MTDGTTTPKTRTRAKKTPRLTNAEREGRTEDFGGNVTAFKDADGNVIGHGYDGPASEEDLARQAANQERLRAEEAELQRQAEMQQAFAAMTPEERLSREIELMQAVSLGGDADANALKEALAEDPYVVEARDIRTRLAELEKNEPALKGVLDKMEAERDDIETKEQERAGSPLALTLEVVECEFATTHYPDPSAGTIPTYAFHEQPCIFGKEHPDQDCRTCVHHRIQKYGRTAPASERRYLNHGWVIPIPDDAVAEKLALYLAGLGMVNLRNIDMEIAYVRHLLSENKRQRTDLIRIQQRRTQGAR